MFAMAEYLRRYSLADLTQPESIARFLRRLFIALMEGKEGIKWNSL